jgi:Uma2 family endonuclease
MATIDSEPLLQPFDVCTRLFIAADLARMPSDLPSGPIDFELDNGRLVPIMVPPGNLHGAAQLRIGTQLMIQGELKGHGKARTEVGVILWKNPDRVVTPDVLFVTNMSLPIRTSREGYLETIPDLVVEIRSKNDSIKYVQRKVRDYLKAGVQVVWVPDSTTQTVTVHLAAGEPKVYSDRDILQLPGLIPDFSMPVADVFCA